MKLFLAIGTVLLAGTVHAAPTVSVSGTLVHGNSVSVTGAGFGTKDPVSPLIWDNDAAFDYDFSRGYTRDTAQANQRHGRVLANWSNDGGDKGVFEHTLGDQDRTGSAPIYISWWYRPTAGQEHPCKFMRSTEVGTSFNLAATTSWAVGTAYAFYGQTMSYCPDAWSEAPSSMEPMQWHHMESRMDPLSGYWKLRGDGYHAQGPLDWDPACTGYKDLRMVLFGWDANAWEKYAAHHLSEVYADLSFQRVLICDAPTFATSVHCEMQIPQNVWTDSQLQIRVNQGSFAAGSTQYLYVFDSTDTPNATGHSIRFSSGADTTPPIVDNIGPSDEVLDCHPR